MIFWQTDQQGLLSQWLGCIIHGNYCTSCFLVLLAGTKCRNHHLLCKCEWNIFIWDKTVAVTIWGTCTASQVDYSFSNDVIESPSWSYKLSQSEHDQPLDGWPQHIAKHGNSNVWWHVSQRAQGCGHSGSGWACLWTTEAVVGCQVRTGLTRDDGECCPVRRHQAPERTPAKFRDKAYLGGGSEAFSIWRKCLTRAYFRRIMTHEWSCGI